MIGIPVPPAAPGSCLASTSVIDACRDDACHAGMTLSDGLIFDRQQGASR